MSLLSNLLDLSAVNTLSDGLTITVDSIADAIVQILDNIFANL